MTPRRASLATWAATTHRIRREIRIVPLAALTATAAAVVAFVLQYPTAAVWGMAVALLLSLLSMVTLVVEANNANLRADAAGLERDIASDLVDRLRKDARIVRPLRSVPTNVVPIFDVTKGCDSAGHVPIQREASDYDWTPPQNSDDALWASLYGPGGEHRG